MCSSRTVKMSAVVLALALLASCGKKEESKNSTAPAPSQTAAAPAPAGTAPAPAAAPAASSSAPVQTASAAAPTTGVIANAQHSDNPDLRCDLLEVKRVSGGALLLRWQIVNTATKTIPYGHGYLDQGLYLIDPEQHKKYGHLVDTERNAVLAVFSGNLPAGERRLNWAKFPAPPPTTTKISVTVPGFAPFEEVPIAQ